MPIMFSAVAKGALVLSKFASCSGNFTETIQQILPMIPPEDKKTTYSTGGFLFHYVSENKLVYFCITDDKFPYPRAFSFLEEVKGKFLASFEGLPAVAVPYAAVNQIDGGAFDRVLQTEMTKYNENKKTLPNIKADLEDLKNIMVQNVDKMTLRGERLENLVDRTDVLASSTTVYRSTAVQVQRKYWWQNIRMQIIMVSVLAVLVYFCGAAACGGLKWPKCI
ncbi:unnamed protein product [Arctia plantaginis]|uniref:Vesicle-associated membrane protein 7 n=1 Tax=Arctia plantaginis TaxID=874455 RepID=A0A8S0ZT66_ARCPL|nr:unnamed protein product [Arctia plantaginis]